MISNKSVTVVRHEEGSVELNASDIVELLRKAGVEVPETIVVSNVRVYFAIPGGGDWSNTDVDIDDRNPIRVEWKIERKVDA